jgi:predicted metal-dependent hydrolase
MPSETFEISQLGPVKFYKNTQAKHLRIIVKTDHTVRVTVPQFCSFRKAQRFVEEKIEWIKIQQTKTDPVPLLSKAGIETLRQKAKAYIPGKVETIAQKFDFEYRQIRIKNLSSRWGSCSAKKNLNFSLHLMRLEVKYIDYVICHELCHTEEMNHGPCFWALLEQIYPQAKVIDREMRKSSAQII